MGGLPFWRVLWVYKYTIVLAVSLCAIAAVVLALTMTPLYKAEALVTQVRDGGMNATASSLVSQLGGLASLAGVSLPPASGPGREAQVLLGSRFLVQEFIKRNSLVAELFPDAKRPPTLWSAVKRFRENVIYVREDIRAGTTTISVLWKDPVKAASWANEFVALANELVRVRAMEESKRNIAYLNDQIAHTNIVDLQRVMYNLIENETKTLMLASARTEYAFRIVDPAVTPEIRDRPQRTLMVLIGILVGLFLGIICAFLRASVLDGRTLVESVKD